MIDRSTLIERAGRYAHCVGAQLGPELGFGVHGIVFALESKSNDRRAAIKVHERERFYIRERDVYQRLAEESVTHVMECAVPQLLRFDDELWVIEMTIVTPPYVLDFAAAYLDDTPDHSEDVLAEWTAEKVEQFGTGWPKSKRFCEPLKCTASTSSM